MEHGFSEEELFKLYRRLMPENEARDLARASVDWTGDVDELPLQESQSGGLSFRVIPQPQLSFDTLVLLSLQSEDAKDKAERYLESYHRGRPMPDELRSQWEDRRAELRKWADDGYPLEP